MSDENKFDLSKIMDAKQMQETLSRHRINQKYRI